MDRKAASSATIALRNVKHVMVLQADVQGALIRRSFLCLMALAEANVQMANMQIIIRKRAVLPRFQVLLVFSLPAALIVRNSVLSANLRRNVRNALLATCTTTKHV